MSPGSPSRIPDQRVNEAVFIAVGGAVDWTMDGAVFEAVYWAVGTAVDWAVSEDLR